MQTRDKEEIRQAVRESYGKVARGGAIAPIIGPETSCCGQTGPSTEKTPAASCCGSPEITSQQLSTLMGYSKEDIDSVPQGANMGLGCGNPVALASLKPGETVVDLGSGGGFHFSPTVLAANKGREQDTAGQRHFRSYATATCDGLLALLSSGITLQDYRAFSPVHKGTCNILYADGSVRTLDDLNEDGFLNNGFDVT